MKKKTNQTEQEAVSNYYDLNTDAIDALVGADEDNSEPVSQEELNKYRGKGKIRVPAWLKIALIKFWFAGAVYYFIGFGLGITNLLDQLFVLGVSMGIVTDLLTNNVIRFLEETPGANDPWILCSRKGYGSFVLNILFGFVIVIGVAGIYWLLEYAADVITADAASIHVGTEPVLFGILCMLVDMMLLGIKHLLGRLICRLRG